MISLPARLPIQSPTETRLAVFKKNKKYLKMSVFIHNMTQNHKSGEKSAYSEREFTSNKIYHKPNQRDRQDTNRECQALAQRYIVNKYRHPRGCQRLCMGATAGDYRQYHSQ